VCENRTTFYPATAYVNTNLNDNTITVLGLHNHAPRLVDVNIFLFNFFQQQLSFMVEGERVGVIFSNLDAIQKYRGELLTVTFAGIDGTFKTVPKTPPQLTKGCLLTFQVVLKNVVSIISKLINTSFYQ